jgi:predicted dehydrogenase
MTLRFGVIGAGTIGQLRARTIRSNPDTSLAVVCDVDAGAARAAAGSDAAVATDLDACFAQPMDAVIVSSPVHLLEEACVRAFERGMHVLVEKPMSNTVDGGRRIVDAAVKAGRVLAVGFNLRYFPAIKYLRDIIDRGVIGDIDHVRVFGGHDGLHTFRADWQYRAPQSGGGATMDVGIHISDLVRYVLGDVTDVYGVMSERVWQIPGSEDNAMAIFRNADGIAATYHATWTEWKGYGVALEVYGSLGMVRGSYAPMQNLLITRARDGVPRKVVRKRYPEIMVREKLRSWTASTLITFDEELRDFVARVGGRRTGPLADGHDGLRSLELAAAVRRSSESREAVHLPPLGPMGG